jgi:hypothetical protein
MKKNLIRVENELYHYENGVKIIGANEEMSGDCTGLSGSCTELW